MKEYKNTKSTVKPEPLVIDECSAWVCENVTEVENGGLIEYEYDMYQYGKDEYIRLISEKSKMMDEALTELILGGVVI
jgi:hypothetical protein